MKVVAVYSVKGGVGKTATAVNLAYLSARAGARTLLWDLDPQGAAGYQLRVRPRVRGGARKLIRRRRPLDAYVRGTDFDGLDVLPADFSFRHLDLALDATRKPARRLRKLIRPLADRYDHVYLDCAPSLSLVSESVFGAADALLVPTIPTPLAMRMLSGLVGHLREHGREDDPAVLPFFCMVDRRKALHRETCREAASAATVPFLEARVPYSSVVEQMGLRRAPVASYAARSAPAAAYEALWRELLGRLGERPPAAGTTRAPRADGLE